MSSTSEQTVSRLDVEQEHLSEVNPGAHWAYLAIVLLGGTLLMLAFIAWLGG